MAWVEIFVVFFVSHAVGDYLVQTDWQALNKRGGLGSDSTARRALLAHIATYTLSFVPALVWLAEDLGPGALAGVAAGIAIPHLIQDDGRLLASYMSSVKGFNEGSKHPVAAHVDQSFHLVALLLVAVAAGS